MLHPIRHIQRSRREFLTAAVASSLGMGLAQNLLAQVPGERPEQSEDVVVLNPRDRVPVSIIIDDSTCLVNLNKFAVPQFAEAMGAADYSQPWRDWPAEIPDEFVCEFADWASENGVKGKYSVVPYPACVGRLDRQLPGWTQQELTRSIQTIQQRLLANWDIHPEMVTHTRVIDTRTGHPYPEFTRAYMENWDWTTGKSVDELTDYLAYALRILKNIDLPCEGVTTPGGFGNRALLQLSQATLAACKDVYQTEIPHYFRHLFDSGTESVAPRVEYAADLQTEHPRCVVSIIGCTGDWTGGWDCSDRGYLDRFITADGRQGRLVEVIDRGEPAVMVCHWTGVYFNGEKLGLRIFQAVVRRLGQRYQHLQWMKLSELARYWAAKELTAIMASERKITLKAPFAAPNFTLRIKHGANNNYGAIDAVKTQYNGTEGTLQPVSTNNALDSGKFFTTPQATTLCFDLPRGTTVISL